ncbi:riboflavin synthase alpha chain [Lacrimispora xylanisolvens]|uniref:Riboflavin synthase n=1 Tax=Lacrimispora xylanisolvens TaxID=384636 RepID=A0A2S6HWE9_9FIRM|nr:riboflavin synthase [Hungatella xylanolytica]PPK82183.1 riboflavin synthase alpha chain [Hungatella xylanolytica]
MFTGIIEETGVLKELKKGAQSASLTIQGRVIFDDLAIGDSVAVNGVCLTAASLSSYTFQADVMHETLSRSCFGTLHPGDFVNLERAMAADGRFGGHIVSGHIDGTGKIISVRRDDNAIWYTIAADSKVLRYIVEKGSIAVDGISLTVASVNNTGFCISAIPHTVKSTTLSYKKAGDPVNLENDLIGKYMEKFLLSSPDKPQPSGITREFLTKSGY